MRLLEKITIRDTEHLEDEFGRHLLHVRDPHALVQAAGYLKFTRAPNAEFIFFRGQTTNHSTLKPTLFRNIGERQAAQARLVQMRNQFISTAAERLKIFSSFSTLSHEPLLQHYGLSTTWIDLVDNIWVALWFACHRARVSGKRKEYLHFETRPLVNNEPNHAYIALVAADSGATKAPGFFAGPSTELADLRIMCPSVFLRPHAQHGVLLRLRGKGSQRPLDYASQIRGIIRVDLSDALNWLGKGTTLSAHSLFPPPYYDHGYKLLLEANLNGNTPHQVGSIAAVGA